MTPNLTPEALDDMIAAYEGAAFHGRTRRCKRDAMRHALRVLTEAHGLVLARVESRVITLCGSTRFKSAYIDWYQRLTDQGWIVLTVGRFLPKRDHGLPAKDALDELHLRKIDMSHQILVLDVGGYIGESTRNEIAHAERTGKDVQYLSQVAPDYREPPLANSDIGLAVMDELARVEAVADQAVLAEGTADGGAWDD